MADREGNPGDTDASLAAAQATLKKLLASPHFRNARRLSEFLRFISLKAAAGEASQISESLIARVVYGREPDYDPAVDSIVRVEANRLRAKLRDYYEAEGWDDAVRLRLPPDSYVPVFEGVRSTAVSAARRGVRHRSTLWVTLAVTLAAVTTMAALVPFSRGTRNLRSSIAVLPFANTGGQERKDYFSDGLSERITNQLGRTGKLQVAARRSAQQLTNRSEDVREIGRRLQVDLVLEGSVRFTCDRIRIDTRLYDTRNGRQVWSGEFDRPAVEASALQDDVSAAVARSLQLSGEGAGRSRESIGWTNDSEALDLYLQARYLFNSRKPENLLKSVQLFDAALKKDSRFALAYAGLAEGYVVLGANEDQDLSQTMPLARQAVARALAIDPTLPEALLTQAATVDNPDFATVERSYRAAIAANPSNANAHHWFGLNLLAVGRFAEAEAEIRQAQLLDPLSLHIGANIGAVYYCSRRYRDTVEQERKILKLDPHLPQAQLLLARGYEGLGQFAEAREILEKMPKTGNSGGLLADLGHVYAVSGQRDQARRIVEMMTTMAKTRHVTPHHLAFVQAGLGHKNEALALLEMSYEQHDAPLAFLKVDPRWDPLRGDPRFQQLLHELHLDK
jgi:serine/threonine-protein kinase